MSSVVGEQYASAAQLVPIVAPRTLGRIIFVDDISAQTRIMRAALVCVAWHDRPPLATSLGPTDPLAGA